MAHELSDLGWAEDDISETESLYEFPAPKVLVRERNNPTNTQDHKDGIPCSQEQNNADQAPDEQPDRKKSSSSLGQASQQPGDGNFHDKGLDDQTFRFATVSERSSSRVDFDPDSETDTHRKQIVEFERLSPMLEGRLLEMIKRKMLFLFGTTTEDVPDVLIDNHGLTQLRFQTDNHTTINLAWSQHSRTETDIKEVLRKQSSIGLAWPRDRNVAGVKQFVIASDGRVPATTVPWENIEQVYQDDLAECGTWEEFESVEYAGYEDTWHRWCFEAATQREDDIEASRNPIRGKIVYCTSSSHSKGLQYIPLAVFAVALSHNEPFSISEPEKHIHRLDSSTSYLSTNFRGGCVIRPWFYSTSSIHWQIRYFTPAGGKGCNDIHNCLLSERQNATIRQDLEEIHLQERRAQISFRVQETSPNLFHILVLSDEVLDSGHLFEGHEACLFWSRYGLELGGQAKIIPVSQYLLQICRVFELSMEAWGKTLDSIDRLVHVNLNDFDDRDRIEDLMFDKSFNRSKNYFVALQLLRIVDEWIDEVIPSIQELRDNPSFNQPAFCPTEVRKNVDAVDRYMKERAGVIQRRIRKKTEEINSLRDGLFNATSLRESTKAMALNQAIYVFTVVTVLFTPVSFLATFWALPFLNNQTEGSDIVPEPPAFRNSFIVMPLLTYVLVLGIAWHVGSENPNVTLSRLIMATWRELREWPRSIWELRPRRSERRRTTSSNA